jgi:hypothetical protein
VALGRAADEIEKAAAGERDARAAERLRAVAAELRARQPPPPEGIPAEVHALLLGRLADIERYSLDGVQEMPIPQVR